MSFFALLNADIKMILRNRSSLFWHFAFPLIFMIIFGLIMGENNVSVKMGLSSESKQFKTIMTKALRQTKNIKIVKGTRKKLKDDLEKGDIDLLVHLGKIDYKKQTDVTIYHDPSKSSGSALAIGVVDSILENITKKQFNVPTIFNVRRKNIYSKELTVISYLMPGIIGMAIMFSGMMGTAYPVVNEREKNILRRLRLTLMKTVTFISAKAVGLVITAFLQAVIIIIIGTLFFNVKIIGSLVSAALIVLVGCLMMVALGFVVAGLSNSTETVDAVSNSIAMPMMFLSGTFFPLEGAPKWLMSISKVLPLTYFSNSLRDILVKGKTLFDVRFNLLIMTAWLLGFLLIAIFTFRWENQKG